MLRQWEVKGELEAEDRRPKKDKRPTEYCGFQKTGGSEEWWYMGNKSARMNI